MKKIKYSILFSAVLSIILFLGMNPANAVSLNDFTGCNITSTQKNYYSNNFDEELKKRGIPKSIKKNGKKLSINKSYAINNCIVIYGNYKDIPTSGKMKQNYGKNGKPQYLGYNIEGKQVENIEYELLGSREDFVKVRHFVKHPWNHSGVKKTVNDSWNPKPIPPDTTKTRIKSGLSKTGELNKAIDTQYLRYAKNPSKLGKRGYFPYVNDHLKHDMKGPNLINYAAVEFFPEDYSFGVFYLYDHCYSYTTFCYSSYAMPPLKTLFNENIDVAITSFTASTTTPWEGNNVKFTATIKNQGEVTAKDLVVRFTYAGNNYKTTLKGNLKPGKSKNVSVTLRSPQVSKDTNYTAKVIVNENGNNPRFESNTNNNSRTLNIKVRNIERDLYVHSIEIDGNEYFDGNKDKLAKLFEGEEVKFRYKLGFKSNKSDEKLVNPVVFYGKEGGKQKEEQITRTIRAGEVTGWINPSFKYSK